MTLRLQMGRGWLVLAIGLSIEREASADSWLSTGAMKTSRQSHTASLLPNGKVLIAGGVVGTSISSAELYDPATGTWAFTGSMTTNRSLHTATLLPNGKVLVAGGFNG